MLAKLDRLLVDPSLQVYLHVQVELIDKRLDVAPLRAVNSNRHMLGVLLTDEIE